MAVNLQLEIARSVDAEYILDMLAKAPASIMHVLVKACAAGSQLLLGRAVKERFTGKGPFPVSQRRLGVVTGLLRRSITHSVPEAGGSGEVVVKMGSNVRYFAVHEFGFAGSVRVRSHQRRGRFVKEHSRRMKIPAREPLQTAIREHGARMYSKAIANGLKKLIEALS